MTKRISPLVIIIPWTLICLFGSAVLSGFDLEEPTLAFGAILAAAPLLIYLALRRPLGLPFALYACLAEFDNLFPPGPFGTIAKLGGALITLMLLVNILYTKRMTKTGPELLAWFIFFLWTGVSLTWSIDPIAGFQLMQQYVTLFILFCLLSVTKADATDMRMAILTVSCAGILLGLFELFTYHNAAALTSHNGSLRATIMEAGQSSNMVDPNQLAASLQAPLALLLMTTFRERHILLKLLYLLGCCIIVGGLLATGSRAGAIGLGVIFLYFLVRGRHRLQIGAITAASLSVSLLIPTVWARFGDQTSGEFGGRLPIWRVAWMAFRDHLLIGQGVGGQILAYDQALREAFQAPAYFEMDRTCHNIFLCTGVQTGIIGIVLLAAAWWYQFRALKNIPADSVLYDLRLALEAATLALLVESCTLDVLPFKYLWLAFALVEIVRGVYVRSQGAPAASSA